MAEVFDSCQEFNAKKREAFLLRAHAVARRIERDGIDSLIRFLVDMKLEELRLKIAEDSGEKTAELRNDYRLWKNFTVEFDQLLKSILEKEPSNGR